MKIKNILSALVLSILACGSISLNNSKQNENRLEVRDVMSEDFSNFGGKTVTPKRTNEDLSQYFSVNANTVAGPANNFTITWKNESYKINSKSTIEDLSVNVGSISGDFVENNLNDTNYQFLFYTGSQHDRDVSIIVYTASGTVKFTFKIEQKANTDDHEYKSFTAEAITVLPSVSEVKVQQKYDSISNTYSMRFVAGISSIELSKVSFNVSITNSEAQTASKVIDVTSCYTDMVVDRETKSASDIFGAKYTHLVAYAVEGIPASTKNFTYNTYVELYDGDEKVNTSDTKSIVLNDIIPYTATFMSNYGNNETIDSIIQYGNGNYSVPDNPTREGYEFKGWNTKSDGSGETITSSTPVELQDNITLYAIWEEITRDNYYVSINSAVGGAYLYYGLKWKNDIYDISSIQSVKLSCDEYSSSSPRNSGIDNNENTLDYTIDLKSANFQVSEDEKTLEVIVKTTSNTFYSIKATFSGKGGDNVDWTITNTEISQLIPLTVTLDYNGGTEANSSVTVLPNTKIGSTLPTSATKEGFTFAGWNTAADGSGKDINSSSTFTENTTIYAKWIEGEDAVVNLFNFDDTFDYEGQDYARANPGEFVWWNQRNNANSSYNAETKSYNYKSTATASDWWADQFFYKLPVSSGTYRVEFELVINGIANNDTGTGKITVQGQRYDVKNGETLKVSYTTDSDATTINIQLGVDGGANLVGDLDVTFSNIVISAQ